jgi:elongation factor Tu
MGDRPFRMTIEDAFEITARGTVVSGRIERGVVRVGDDLELTRANGSTRSVRVRGIELTCPPLDRSRPADPNLIGLLLEPDLSKAELSDYLALEAR